MEGIFKAREGGCHGNSAVGLKRADLRTAARGLQELTGSGPRAAGKIYGSKSPSFQVFVCFCTSVCAE